jgi:uncharacterized protein YjbI with pentapeptide repeats
MTIQTKHFLTGLILGILIAGGVSFFFLNKLSGTQKQEEKLQAAHQAELAEAERRSGLVNLMGNIMNKIDEEFKQNPRRVLSDETIGRIAALSYSFVPHRDLVRDSSSEKILSPERGQLLLMLSKLKMDSASFKKIIVLTSFSGAVLREGDLRGADLEGINLSGADLQGTNLKDANLYGADLKMANLWDANFSNANLSGADLTRANLSWAELNGADLKRARLYGADLTSAQLRKADLQEADLQWADINSTFLPEANLTKANLFRANLIRTNLDKSILNEANLKMSVMTDANFSGADLTGAKLNGAEVTDGHWLDLLDEWHVTGAKEIQAQHKMIDETFNHQPKFHIEKNKE